MHLISKPVLSLCYGWAFFWPHAFGGEQDRQGPALMTLHLMWAKSQKANEGIHKQGHFREDGTGWVITVSDTSMDCWLVRPCLEGTIWTEAWVRRSYPCEPGMEGSVGFLWLL